MKNAPKRFYTVRHDIRQDRTKRKPLIWAGLYKNKGAVNMTENKNV